METNEYRYDAATTILDLPEDVGDSVRIDNLIEQHMLDCVLFDQALSFSLDEKKTVLKTISDKAVRPEIMKFLESRPIGDFDRLENRIRNLCHMAAGVMETIEIDAIAEARAYIRDQIKKEEFCHA